jgi:glycosyltransferase involved in cell wall biosynthesis
VQPAEGVPVVENSFNVLFAGNVGEAQDFPAILAAAESLRSNDRIRWLIVGDGRAAGWVAAEIERRGLEKTVLMLGRHPLEQMPRFYKHADVLLISLKNEPIFSMTLPGKLQSYLAFGMPVLAMLNGEGAEIVRESGAGLACPAGDGRALAAAVLDMASRSEAERAQMGRNGRAYCAREFDRGVLISRLESWLEGLNAVRAPGARR